MIRILALMLGSLVWASTVLAFDAFNISDIRVEGLQRISEGTVYNYLPLDAGDNLTQSNSRSAIRELYRTGFFQDIAFGRDGNILVITVRERPAIANVALTGTRPSRKKTCCAFYTILACQRGRYSTALFSTACSKN